MATLKIMKRILPILFLFAGSYQCIGQSTLSSQGDVSYGKTMSLSWTLGELATATLATESGFLTEGVQQPLLQIVSISTEEEGFTPTFRVAVLPNPVQDQLNVEITPFQEIIFSMHLYDANGKIVFKKRNEEKSQRSSIDMSALASGLYFLHIQDEKGRTIETFKVTKF